MATERDLECRNIKREVEWLKEDKKFENSLSKKLKKLLKKHQEKHGGVFLEDCELCSLYKENIEFCRDKSFEYGEQIKKVLRSGV